MSISGLKCLQWNARGLTKSRLEEFRSLLNSLDPDLVFISETHWNKKYQIRFKNFATLNRDRNTRRGGGVALLVKNSLQFSALPSSSTSTLEVIGAKIQVDSGAVHCFSVYCPKGDCQADEIKTLLNCPSPVILAGDLNAHHSLWESNSAVNAAGKAITAVLTDHPDACLITPKDLGTRIDPCSGHRSTIDLIITSTSLSLNATFILGPYTGSDHLPNITTLNANPTHLQNKPPSWIFNVNKWTEWNSELERKLSARDFSTINDPSTLYDSFSSTLIDTSKTIFKMSCQSSKLPKEPRRRWWTSECQAAVNNARSAEKE